MTFKKSDNEQGKDTRDEQLGMDRNITRRDFLNGVAIGVGGALASANFPELLAAQTSPPSEQDTPGYYPPTRTGLRGNHPGSFEVAHALRDGKFWKTAGKPIDSGEKYALIVVGGGMSGLASAYFYRRLSDCVNSARRFQAAARSLISRSVVILNCE